ncbi:hypothetical protein RDABS01_030554 [Bienertia sinuspersici]
MSLEKKLKLSINDADRFSELPEHMIHHILSFVSIKDVVRTRLLSKTWKSLSTSYKILLDLHYDHNSFAMELLLDTESAPEIDEIRDRFMDYADNHLLRVVQQQIPVLKLAVDVAVIGSEFFRVDQFMELVGKAKAEELSIFVQTRDFHWYYADEWDEWYDGGDIFEEGIFYEFPYSITLAKWLRSLTIRGCKVTSLASKNFISNNNASTYSSLRQLCLSRVLLFSEEALSNIASCCPGIEVIEFNCCNFLITTLKLSKFTKLKKASVVGQQEYLESVDITETNLESFHCSCVDLNCLISLAACRYMRVLELHHCYLSEPDLLKDLTTSFPLLEKAKLFDGIPYEGLDSITVANSDLTSLKLLFNRDIRVISVKCPNLRHFDCYIHGLEEVYLDCPKLRTCYYNSLSVPRLILLDLPTDIEYIVFSFSLHYKLDKSWFISIWKFLEQIVGCNTVYLHLYCLSPSTDVAEFGLDELEAVQAFKPKNVHLQVVIGYAGERRPISAAFVDALLWSTCPATLSIGGDCYNIVKYLCEKLAEKSRDGSCCDQHYAVSIGGIT